MKVTSLKNFYREEIIPSLKKEFNYKSVMEVPSLKKIVISQGLGVALADKKILDYALEELSLIAGQKAIHCLSKKDESGFKLRKGVPIGIKVTLRRDKMYSFLEKLIWIALPRVRDFRGLNPKGFDGRGNYNMGLIEQIVFPEISIGKVKKILGMNIAFITTAQSDEEAKSLLGLFGMLFKKK